jgi:imidazole glycerol phosphate synthase glutamine amidotransferase subunit
VSTVVVIDYGAGNTRSVQSALKRLGVNSIVSADCDSVLGADTVILPGVGSARSAMDHLRSTGADEALRERVRTGKNTVGICLGMQLALEYSEEDGGVATLALVKGTVRRLHATRTPRLGWANVSPWNEAYYFAHSYYCESASVTATSDDVAAALSFGSFVGVQFHPEKSGAAGEKWLASCLTRD